MILCQLLLRHACIAISCTIHLTPSHLLLILPIPSRNQLKAHHTRTAGGSQEWPREYQATVGTSSSSGIPHTDVAGAGWVIAGAQGLCRRVPCRSRTGRTGLSSGWDESWIASQGHVSVIRQGDRCTELYILCLLQWCDHSLQTRYVHVHLCNCCALFDVWQDEPNLDPILPSIYPSDKYGNCWTNQFVICLFPINPFAGTYTSHVQQSMFVAPNNHTCTPWRYTHFYQDDHHADLG